MVGSGRPAGLDTNLRGRERRLRAGRKRPRVRRLVWASGSNGVILRSLDAGKNVEASSTVAGGDALDFRGIVAFSAATAYLMSSGEGEKSHIFKTTDGGENLDAAIHGQPQRYLS